MKILKIIFNEVTTETIPRMFIGIITLASAAELAQKYTLNINQTFGTILAILTIMWILKPTFKDFIQDKEEKEIEQQLEKQK